MTVAGNLPRRFPTEGTHIENCSAFSRTYWRTNEDGHVVAAARDNAVKVVVSPYGIDRPEFHFPIEDVANRNRLERAINLAYLCGWSDAMHRLRKQIDSRVPDDFIGG